MRHWNCGSLILLSLFLVASAHAQPSFDFAGLERTAAEEVQSTRTPGATVVVVSGDRVVFSKGFGLANMETKAPVTTDMLFRLGSTTKMFTAAALLQLVEQGRIKLNEPIGSYVKNLHPRVAALTADQILSHKTGLWDESPMYGPQDDAAMAEGIRKWRDDRFFADAGSIYSYSNPGYWLAGLVIEEVSGKQFADHLAASLLAPLGMTRSTFRPLIALTYPIALGHDVLPTRVTGIVRPMANNAASWPSGSLFSSGDELSRFVIAFLNEGRIDGQQVLSPAVIAALSAAHADIPGTEEQYGYGLFLGSHRGMRTLEHGGARLGHGSLIRMVPERKFGVIVLTNRSGAQLPNTVTKAMEIVLPLAPASPEAMPTAVPMDEAEMKKHVGVYSQGANKIEILMRDGRLFAQQGPTQIEVVKLGGERYGVLLPNMLAPAPFAMVAGPDGRTQFLHQGGRSLKRTQ